MKREPVKKVMMAIIAITGWLALALQLYIMLRNAPSLGIRPLATIVNFFSFFTILGNLMVATSLTAVLLAAGSAAGKFFSKPVIQTAIGLYIIVVGIVYSVALRHVWSPTGLQLVADHILHDVIPVLYLVFWFVFIPKQVLLWKHVLPLLVFPLLYLIYSLSRGAFTGWYPYPFVNADELGYGRVALNTGLVLLAFLGLGSMMIAYNRIARRR